MTASATLSLDIATSAECPHAQIELRRRDDSLGSVHIFAQPREVHKWEKPRELAERFILHSTEPGALVVDPFAGSSAFLFAAGKLGRQAVGCELDQSLVESAVERGCVSGS